MKNVGAILVLLLGALAVIVLGPIQTQAQSDRIIVDRPGDPLDRDPKRPDRSDYEVRTALASTSSQVEAALKYAKEAFEAKPPRYSDAEKYYSEAAKLNPKDERAYIGLGTVYAGQDRVKDAIEAFQKAIEIKPKSPVPHFNLGVIFLAIGKKVEAMEQYTTLNSLDPKLAKKLKEMIDARFNV
jgi:tetratricopeptide (TPR) repeat protein